jgi:hypothetical protein
VFDGQLVKASAGTAGERLPTPGGASMPCLAPDDLLIVHESEFGPIAGEADASLRLAGLLASETGDWFEIRGTFAGWLEVGS